MNLIIKEIYSSVNARILTLITISAFIIAGRPIYTSFFIFIFEIFLIYLILIKNAKDIKNNLYKMEKTHILTIVLCIASITFSTLILLVENIGNERKIFGLLRYLEMLSHILFFLVLSLYLTNKKYNYNFFYPLPISLSIAATIIIIDFNFNSNSIMSDHSFKILISHNIRYLGYITMLGCLYCVVSLIYQTKKIAIYSFMALFIINFSLLVWLGGRGSILAFILSSIATMVIIKKDIINKIKYIINIIGLMVISCLVSFPLNVYTWNGLNRFVSIAQNTDMTVEKLSNGRFSLWIESVNFILDSPLWGHGPEAHLFLTKIGFLQPHNSILQFLLEFGIFGALLFGIMLLFILIQSMAIAIKTDNSNELFLFNLILSILIHSLYDGTLYHAPPLALFCIASACVYSSILKNK